LQFSSTCTIDIHNYLVYNIITMLRTNVYLTEEQERAIKFRAAITKKPKAAVIRDIIENGLKVTPAPKDTSTQIFLNLAKLAEEFKDKGTAPKDLSTNLDKYIWDE